MLLRILELLLAFFETGNIILILLSTYLPENSGSKAILCATILLLKKKSYVLISMVVVKIKM